MTQSLRIKIVVKALTAEVERLMIALALQILANLVASPNKGGTPVDTGWARVNWVPNVGSPAIGVAGSRKSVTGAAQKTGESKVLSYKLTSGKIHITNNVPYILRLNDGSSQQAPRAFVQTAIKNAVQRTLGSRAKRSDGRQRDQDGRFRRF